MQYGVDNNKSLHNTHRSSVNGMVCVLIDMIYIYNEFRGFSVI